jgi:archaemetzincin
VRLTDYHAKPIRLIPVGNGVLQPERLDRLAGRLEQAFTTECRISPAALDVHAAYDPWRNQYHSSAILHTLEGLAGGNGVRVLGITSLDLFVPVLTFVFGEAQLKGDCALVSTHRLREEFYGLPARDDLLDERLLKEAVHELGHTFGLRHCDDWECVMASTHAVERLDLKGPEFCDSCKQMIDRMETAVRRR